MICREKMGRKISVWYSQTILTSSFHGVQFDILDSVETLNIFNITKKERLIDEDFRICET